MEWEEEINKKEGFSAAEKAKMLMSKETREGLKITGQTSDSKY